MVSSSGHIIKDYLIHNVVELLVNRPFELVGTPDKVDAFDSSFCAAGEDSSVASTTKFARHSTQEKMLTSQLDLLFM